MKTPDAGDTITTEPVGRYVREEAEKRLSGSDLAKSDGQPAFIPGRRVLLYDAPLGRAIDQRIGLRHQLSSLFDILGFEQAPHRPNAMAQTGLPSAINQGTMFGHAHAFERRYSICHSNLKNTVVGPAGSNCRA